MISAVLQSHSIFMEFPQQKPWSPWNFPNKNPEVHGISPTKSPEVHGISPAKTLKSPWKEMPFTDEISAVHLGDFPFIFTLVLGCSSLHQAAFLVRFRRWPDHFFRHRTSPSEIWMVIENQAEKIDDFSGFQAKRLGRLICQHYLPRLVRPPVMFATHQKHSDQPCQSDRVKKKKNTGIYLVHAVGAP